MVFKVNLLGLMFDDFDSVDVLVWYLLVMVVCKVWLKNVVVFVLFDCLLCIFFEVCVFVDVIWGECDWLYFDFVF